MLNGHFKEAFTPTEGETYGLTAGGQDAEQSLKPKGESVVGGLGMRDRVLVWLTPPGGA